MAMFDQTRTPHADNDVLTPGKREEIVRRYWMKGELTPLAVANRLAGQRPSQAA
jgi:hypothetical protein